MIDAILLELAPEMIVSIIGPDGIRKDFDGNARKRGIAKEKLEQICPLPTDKLCYSCGNKLFKYDNAFRCIYCGMLTTEGIS